MSTGWEVFLYFNDNVIDHCKYYFGNFKAKTFSYEH